MPDSIRAQEQKHLDAVVAKIRTAQTEAKQRIDSAEDDEAGIRKNFVNDLRIKTDSYEGLLETALSVRQQQQLLAERQNSWQHATTELSTLQRLEKKAYFARIDFQEGPKSKPETIYIGLGSFSDTPDHFLIYDWRAPISSIYYDGELGDVSYQTPDGEQTVDVQLKRQFQIEDGTIVTLYDTDQTVTDQMLLSALSEHSDTKMKSIVTTIQKEQNQIIRDTKSDLLFVQGAAGSGKTAAILQRVAYLLYRYRGHLNAGQVMLFSPNQLFNDYIDQVLPELGEHNMVQMTYYQYAGRRLPKIEVETLAQRFGETNTPAQKQINRLKGSLAFFDAVTAYADHLEASDMVFRNIKFQGNVFIPKEKIESIYYSFNRNYHLANRLQATKEALIRILNRRISSEMKTKWVEQAIQDLSKQELDSLYGDDPREFESSDKEFQFLARKIVMKAFDPIRKAIVRARFLSINNQYVHMLRDMPNRLELKDSHVSVADWNASVEETITKLKDHRMQLVDTTPYLYLYDKMTGKTGERDMRYVFMDEIQDYNAFQLAFLKYSFPRARFTMLGDLNQAIFTKENSRTLLQELSTMFDPDKTRVVQLTQSYRSTQQVTDFTKHILKNGEAVTAFAREGELPTITVAPDEAAARERVIAQLKQNNAEDETTAIIGKDLADCRSLTEELKAAGVAVTLIQSENQRLAPGVIVVPSFLAKGLEFDAVIVWQASASRYAAEDERQLLYTICSRAMHRLSIVGVGELSPLLSDVPEVEYTVTK
ncbi:superfamily I DNA RNA helicase [Levilactobacillus senmaizukei DSM 21775 = NBRC 103853]|uniref:Superfamily I DNA RNA helicase n=1 Tax=Levilactobacillus senmaizukei DSM 21775 = NBRC 103853 TaxID=1423803 RepID=A0A0R2DJB4_9LACO|nr:RNA polymerase recycling motor HelD [Levilactobacillus senmaizukei]KRN03195.1 superfamily I DNA RNA helicase [Levilactobacillus senmaizukei DSM 21775 = NBRC 103853]